MNEHSEKAVGSFFDAIGGWLGGYAVARLHVLGVRRSDALEIVAGRVYLDPGGDVACKASFRSQGIEAHQLMLDRHQCDLQAVVRALASADGYQAAGYGRLKLPSTEQVGIYAAPAALLHPEGLNSGNRLGVLSIVGAPWADLLPQPESDWQLKAADAPYDSVQELAADYRVGAVRGDRCLIEVVARTVIEVLAEASVKGRQANLGVLMAGSLDKAKAKLGLRVLEKGQVIARSAVHGRDLTWHERDFLAVGTTQIEVPEGSVVQCIASYADQAHHVQWRGDPATFSNPRAAIMSLVDPSSALMQAYLRPDTPPKGRTSDDFETAVGWLLWALGFAVAQFGTHPRTKDAFDLVATAPRGDFVVVECTLGLLRAEGKLAKLTARTVSVREALAASNMKHLRVLPVIVTAMTNEQVEAESDQAAELGVLVVTRDDFDEIQRELIRFPDADALFERGLQAVRDRQSALKAERSDAG